MAIRACNPLAPAPPRRAFVLIELLIVVAIIYLATPMGRSTLGRYGVTAWIWGGLLGVFVTWLLVYKYAGVWIGGLYGRRGHERALSSRRRITRRAAARTRAERRADAMSDAALDDAIEKRPADPTLIEAKLERVKAADDRAAHARELEYFLTLDAGLTLEEKCRLHNELADLYALELNQPARARAALHALIAEFPRSYQATLARARLTRMQEDEGTE